MRQKVISALAAQSFSGGTEASRRSRAHTAPMPARRQRRLRTICGRSKGRMFIVVRLRSNVTVSAVGVPYEERDRDKIDNSNAHHSRTCIPVRNARYGTKQHGQYERHPQHHDYARSTRRFAIGYRRGARVAGNGGQGAQGDGGQAPRS